MYSIYFFNNDLFNLIGSGDFDKKSIKGQHRHQLVNVTGKNHKYFLYCIIFLLHFKTMKKSPRLKDLFQYDCILNGQKWN